jgi:hypothetical protein
VTARSVLPRRIHWSPSSVRRSPFLRKTSAVSGVEGVRGRDSGVRARMVEKSSALAEAYPAWARTSPRSAPTMRASGGSVRRSESLHAARSGGFFTRE